MPELMKLLSTKSMIRYLPPKGTAGLARSRVSGKRRVPLPPASTIPSTRMRIASLFQAIAGSARGGCTVFRPMDDSKMTGMTDLRNAAVIGTGMMGPGIALTLALAGLRTTILSRTEDSAARGLEKARAQARLLAENDLADRAATEH